jgi:predicted PurR-regulated permease PerM
MPQTTPEPEVVSSATPASTTRSLLALHVAIAIIAALYFAREVLIPIALAVLLSFVLSPLVDRLRGWRLWRVPSVLISVIVAIGIMLAIGGVIGTQIAQLARNIPQYSGTIEQKITSVQTYVTDRIATVTARLGLGAAREGAGTTDPAAQPGTPATQAQTKPEQSSSTSPVSIAERYLFPILSPIATAGIVLVVAIFLLLQKEDLRDRLIRLFGSTDLHRTTLAMDDAAARLSRYLLTQLGINTAFGVIVGTGLYFIGVPNPLLWGVLSGILRFVPYVGSFAAAGLPILLAAAVDPGWSMAIWTAALYVAVELTVSQAVEPVFVWPQHGAVAVRGDRIGDLLELVMGRHRPDIVDAADPVPRRARPAFRATAIPRRAAGRPATADAGRKFLSANSRARS